MNLPVECNVLMTEENPTASRANCSDAVVATADELCNDILKYATESHSLRRDEIIITNSQANLGECSKTEKQIPDENSFKRLIETLLTRRVGGKKLSAKQLVGRQLRFLNSLVFNKVKLFLLLMAFLLTFGHDLALIQYVRAGFWTFYFPNYLKPCGYKEMTKTIEAREIEINSIKDNYADVRYFWELMSKIDDTLKDSSEANFQLYPEESVCEELFPMFRDMAIDYSKIDYEYYMKPLQINYEELIRLRDKWFPEGSKSKNILPRHWEQEIYERELLTQIDWAEILAGTEEFKEKRKRMVELYDGVKRSLDTSLPCLYLKYAFRQISEDINQLALEMNINAMTAALDMVRKAYKRIEKFKESDHIAIEAISDQMNNRERFNIKS